MTVLIVAAGLALGMLACIEVQRPEFVIDSTPDGEGDVLDMVETQDGTVAEEVEVSLAGCAIDQDCAQPADACRERICVDSQCLERAKDEGALCRLGDPCSAGACHRNVCVRSGPAVDGTSCDDGLLCNGVSLCSGGLCGIALPQTCVSSGAPCAGGAVCSEELGGQCVDLPADDGLPCPGPVDAAGVAQPWLCSAGRCVPPDMVFVPGGVFTMGCPAGYCDEDNGPAHEVRLSPFAIDRTELSEAEFRACRDDVDHLGSRCARRPNEDSDQVVSQDGTMPARWLDWSTAERLCVYQGKRLCTEAEWEYAAGGTGAAFYPWGNLPPTCERATFFDEGAPGCGLNAPSRTGSKPLGASLRGVFEMAGNVNEWCADYYRADLYASRAGTTPVDPVQALPVLGQSHVVRGGSYRDGVGPLRVFVRSAQPSEVNRDDLGARCCLSLGAP